MASRAIRAPGLRNVGKLAAAFKMSSLNYLTASQAPSTPDGAILKNQSCRYHHINGPRLYGPTLSYALANLVDPKEDPWSRRPGNPTQRVKDGSIGVLDTRAHTFAYITEDWLGEINGDTFELGDFLDRLRRSFPFLHS